MAIVSPGGKVGRGPEGPPPPRRVSAQAPPTWPHSSPRGALVTGKDGSVALAWVVWATGEAKQLAQFWAFINISFGDDWSGPLVGGEMQGKTEVLKTVFTVFLINSSWGCPRLGARLQVSSPVSWPLKERGLT